MAFELEALPYAYDALEPYIDEATLHFHHDKHHQTYLNNLNGLLEKTPELAERSVEEILSHITHVPEAVRVPVRNNAGGVWNHDLYFGTLGPKAGGEPKGDLLAAINAAFVNFDRFKDVFSAAGLRLFGSGWAWLVKSGSSLEIVTTPNQDCPLSDGKTPILALDVWEHAYYLKYQNRRVDYIAAFWNVVNWNAVADRLR